MIHKPWVRNAIIAAICVVFAWLLISMRQVLSPLFIALAIAYVFDPLIDRFERWKISRTWGIVILTGLIVLVMLGLSLYLLPRLMQELSDLTGNLAKYWARLKNELWPGLEEYLDNKHPGMMDEYKAKSIAWLQEHAGELLQSISSGLATSFKSIGAFVGNLLGLVIIPVLAFYLLRDFDVMTGKIAELIPLNKRNFVSGLIGDLHGALSNFIKGQLLVAIILSLIYSVGLMIAGCPAALLIGIIAGFANLIPYLGIALGFVPAVLLTYLSGNPTWQVVLAASTFVVGQMLEGMVITPKVVGESIGLHPVVVLIGIMIGGTYFGFVGMILALPCTAILMVLLRRTHAFYVSSVLFHDGDLPAVIEPEEPSAPAETPEAEV